MSIDQGLLQKVIDDSDDDSVRLVYSDWLEENGDRDRATFIRLQIARARSLPPWPEPLSPTESELLATHAERWNAPILAAAGVRNAKGLAEYLPKHVKDRSKVEMPPPMWSGRRCRFVWRSKGFLTKSKERLWQEQFAEWYPAAQPKKKREVGGNFSTA